MASIGRKQRAVLVVSLPALLLGWLAPGYASKCFGVGLNTFMRDQPLMAALIMQSSWIPLLLVPRSFAGDDGIEHPAMSAQGPRTSFYHLAGKVGMPLGTLVVFVNICWYASIPRTSVATNTVLWNSDTISTPLILALLSWQRPSGVSLLAGAIGLLGVSCSVSSSQVGNSNLGCALCLAATTGYAVNAIFAEKVTHKYAATLSVTKLLGLQGLTACTWLTLAVIGAAVAAPKLLGNWYAALPSLQWLAFFCASGLTLNIGWLVSTAIAGATWTAMGACLSIPLSIILDLVLLDMVPDVLAVLGACLVLVGFTIVSVFPEVPQANCSSCPWLLSSPSTPLLLPVDRTESDCADIESTGSDEATSTSSHQPQKTQCLGDGTDAESTVSDEATASHQGTDSDSATSSPQPPKAKSVDDCTDLESSVLEHEVATSSNDANCSFGAHPCARVQPTIK